MRMKYKDYIDEIQKYCKENHISFEKLNSMVKGCGNNDIMFLYHDPDKGKDGLLDETPMPLVLLLTKEPSGKLVFKQTEHTQKYLGID